jgi:branched-chain amino acid aminotransferase
MIQEQPLAGRPAPPPPEGARATSPKLPAGELGFGRYFTDHLFVAEFDQDRGWRDPRVVPRATLAMDPAASALQYGQSVFEGLKAFRDPRGGAHRLFRLDRHTARLRASARRVCLPEVPEDLFADAVRSAIRADADWMPTAEGTAIYIRPTLLGTEAFLGVRPSTAAMFYVLLSPVGSYWQGGRRPLRIWVEDTYVRAALGGLGAAKTGANYAASLLAAEVAKSRGYDQVLWLDAERRERVEEIGTMNLFARIGDTVITPAIDGTILDGVTRASVLDLLREWGVKTEERPLDLAEIIAAHASGTLREMFGTGTAAIIAPLGALGGKPGELTIGDGREGELTRRLFDEIRAIQSGAAEDRHGWLTPV